MPTVVKTMPMPRFVDSIWCWQAAKFDQYTSQYCGIVEWQELMSNIYLGWTVQYCMVWILASFNNPVYFFSAKQSLCPLWKPLAPLYKHTAALGEFMCGNSPHHLFLHHTRLAVELNEIQSKMPLYTDMAEGLLDFIKSGRWCSVVILGSESRDQVKIKGWMWKMEGLLDTDWKVDWHSFLTLWSTSGHTWMIRKVYWNTSGWGYNELFGGQHGFSTCVPEAASGQNIFIVVCCL